VKGVKPAIGVAVLLVVTTVALRGHVPGVGSRPVRPDPPPGNDPLALALVALLLAAAMAVVVLAAVVRWRRRGSGVLSIAARPDWLRDDAASSWRHWSRIVAFAVASGVVLWLIATLLLSQFRGDDSTGAPAARSPGASDPQAPATVEHGLADPDRPMPTAGNGHLLDYLYAATGILLLALIAGTVIATRAHRRPAPVPPLENAADDELPPDASAPLVRAAEVGLAEVEDLSREPRKAIIACYAAMEHELANVPDAMPQDFDTASEVLARAVEHHALGPGSATQLVELFDEARFSPHLMGEGHRDLAVEVLQRVLDELRSRA
jgi:Domain of unknown function (DUF4129)